MRRSLVVSFVLVACGGGDGSPQAWDPSTTGVTDDPGDTVGTDVPDESTSQGEDTSDDDPQPTTQGTSVDDESSTGAPSYDCTPWATQWIGGPCADDGQCTYDGG